MISQLSEIFVERRAPRAPRIAMRVSRRLLAVELRGAHGRLVDLLEELERSVPLGVSLVAIEQLDCVPVGAAFDAVLLFADETAERSYCNLIANELAARFSAPVAIVAAGGGERAPGDWIALDWPAVGPCPPWRRRAATRVACDRLIDGLAQLGVEA